MPTKLYYLFCLSLDEMQCVFGDLGEVAIGQVYLNYQTLCAFEAYT